MSVNPENAKQRLIRAEERLAKAQEEVAFWKRIWDDINDPRFAEIDSDEFPSPKPPSDLRTRVYKELPQFGSMGITVTAIISKLQEGGQVLSVKFPAVAINEVLSHFRKKNMAICIGRSGKAQLWTKTDAGENAASVNQIECPPTHRIDHSSKPN